MKTFAYNLIALTAIALLLILPCASNAQVGIALNSYFGHGNAKLAFCQARTLIADNSIQGAVNFSAPQGSIAIQATTLTTKQVISGNLVTNYALLSGWGYWTPAGTTQDIPCLVTAQFTQNNANMATLAVQVTNYATGQLIYSSGTLEEAGKNVIAIGVTSAPIITPPANNTNSEPSKTAPGKNTATAATTAK